MSIIVAKSIPATLGNILQVLPANLTDIWAKKAFWTWATENHSKLSILLVNNIQSVV